jgi:hypothetical protein
MLFDLICDIEMVGIERFGWGESKWSLKGNVMNSQETQVHHQGRRSA